MGILLEREVQCRHLIVCYGVLPGVRNDGDLLFWGEKHCCGFTDLSALKACKPELCPESTE